MSLEITLNIYYNAIFIQTIKDRKGLWTSFPEKKKGLAVIWLYERMKNGEFKHGIFKEKDIHHAFEAVSLIKGEPVRLQWVTYTAYILEL